MTYEEFWQPLTAVYERREARAVALLAMETRYGLTLADLLCGRTGDDAGMRLMQQRLLRGEPVQYVLGQCEFGGRPFGVGPGVLIPRPETLELCEWIVETERQGAERERHLLDIGTGSGCIAVTLAAELPQARVTGWDISDDALSTAADNARRNHASVTFQKVDILSAPAADRPLWDVVVSNPPYVCRSEAADMERHVLDFEPHLALFVPDADPLLFYRHIAGYAARVLQPGGRLFLEINPRYAAETEAVLHGTGYGHTTVREDQYGKKRMICAWK